MTDLFQFWADVPGDSHWHPADQDTLGRTVHNFQLQCLPGPFKGKLRTAPVVILTLSPGFNKDYDVNHALSQDGQRYYFCSRTGKRDLPAETEHQESAKWSAGIIRQFGIEYEDARSKVAILNITPYKSKDFTDWHMLAALPSCRAALAWAQSSLFVEAEAGNRVVVCLRSAKHWGLASGRQYQGNLFAPIVTKNGRMVHGPVREKVAAVVRAACHK